MLKFSKLSLILSWLLFIFLTSHIAFAPEDPARIKLWYEYTYDKSMHLIMYGFLAYLAVSFLIEYKNLRRPRIFWITVLFCYLYGITDEWHQSFVGGRGVSYYDLAFNVIAAAGGFSVYKIWHVIEPNLDKRDELGFYARDLHVKKI